MPSKPLEKNKRESKIKQTLSEIKSGNVGRGSQAHPNLRNCQLNAIDAPRPYFNKLSFLKKLSL